LHPRKALVRSGILLGSRRDHLFGSGWCDNSIRSRLFEQRYGVSCTTPRYARLAWPVPSANAAIVASSSTQTGPYPGRKTRGLDWHYLDADGADSVCPGHQAPPLIEPPPLRAQQEGRLELAYPVVRQAAWRKGCVEGIPWQVASSLRTSCLRDRNGCLVSRYTPTHDFCHARPFPRSRRLTIGTAGRRDRAGMAGIALRAAPDVSFGTHNRVVIANGAPLADSPSVFGTITFVRAGFHVVTVLWCRCPSCSPNGTIISAETGPPKKKKR
jgi:hypothetical protein